MNDSSWNTAFSTGAVGPMGYEQVRRYSQPYGLRQLFNSSMDHYLESRRDMYAFLTRVNLPDKIVGDGIRGREARYCLGDGNGAVPARDRRGVEGQLQQDSG